MAVSGKIRKDPRDLGLERDPKRWEKKNKTDIDGRLGLKDKEVEEDNTDATPCFLVWAMNRLN